VPGPPLLAAAAIAADARMSAVGFETRFEARVDHVWPTVVKQSSWRRVQRTVLGCLGGLALAVVVFAVMLKYEPGFYRQLEIPAAISANALPAGDAEDVEALARRAMTKASAWHASISRTGSWETAVTASELNAWLAVDLPRNHPRWLPQGVTRPRLVFRPRHIVLGTRVGYGPLTAVAWLDCEVLLRDVNHLIIVLEQAWLGAIPVPRAPILRELARRISRLGMVTDLRMMDGKTVLMVYIPSTHDAGATSYWLESLSIGDGELLMAGETRSSPEIRERPAPPSS
jgi:hypothetical protein